MDTVYDLWIGLDAKHAWTDNRSAVVRSQQRFFEWRDVRHWSAVGADSCDASRVSNSLRSRFLGVRAFHACRAHSVRRYIERGIRGHDPDELRRQAHAAFSPLFTARRIDRAFEAVRPGLSGMSYLALDSRFLVQEAAHYLVYGSEHLNAVAIGLDGCDFGTARGLLARLGTPTVFECQLPWSSLHNSVMPDFVQDLASSIVEGSADHDWAKSVDFTCFVENGVSPSFLCGHWHVSRAPDVHRGGATHDIEGSACDECAESSIGGDG